MRTYRLIVPFRLLKSQCHFGDLVLANDRLPQPAGPMPTSTSCCMPPPIFVRQVSSGEFMLGMAKRNWLTSSL